MWYSPGATALISIALHKRGFSAKKQTPSSSTRMHASALLHIMATLLSLLRNTLAKADSH
jgi:hypothetical protein